ncbi:MAG: flagellar assembly protein FliH [Enterobacteriaceae bacterium]|jgi:flagellar assembly protein FliH|nr:flagellar assembly protein FliH [Enterobacteriaceae bacterium]
MSTSNRLWQRWKPDNLLDEIAPLDVFSRSECEPVSDLTTEAMQQAELTRLRQQAEQNGRTQGLQKGEEEGRKQGYDAGYQQGREEGLAQGIAAGLAQQEQQAAQFSRLLDAFQDSLDNLDSVIPSRLVQVALTAARAVIGDYIISGKTNAALLADIRQRLNEDSLLNGSVRLWISAEEPEATRKQLEKLLADHHWELCIDPHILPGGCRISTEEGELDASLETRWQALCSLSRSEGER